MIRIIAINSSVGKQFRQRLIGINVIYGGQEMEVQKERTISQEFEDIKEQICNEYCKYPGQWDEKVMGYELCESEVCAQCPLNRL